MLKPIDRISVDIVPQAIIDMSIDDAVGQTAKVVEDIDDLDHFRGAAYRLNDHFEIALRHYRGFPANKVSIYIDRDVSNIEMITSLIRTILADLKISPKALLWERQNNPEL